MTARDIGHTPHVFSDKVRIVAERTNGVMLFDVRVDGDRHIQRIAAVAYQSEGVGLLALDRSGESLIAHFVRDGIDELTMPLARWSSLALSEQATSDCLDAARRLVAAVRNQGHLLRAA